MTMMQRLKVAEVPLAYTTFGLAVLVVMWKTIGLSMIPGWDAVWGDAPEAQYPRRPSSETSYWDLFYLVMYGGLGTIAQYAGLKFSTTRNKQDTTLTETNKQRAQLLGLFHCVIGLHHIVWSMTRSKWGQLELSHLNLPLGGYVFAGMWVTWTAWHGLSLLTTACSTSKLDDVIRHKVLVDASSVCSLIELFGFLPANWFGYRNANFERVLWMLTFGTPLVLFMLNEVEVASSTKKDDTKKEK